MSRKKINEIFKLQRLIILILLGAFVLLAIIFAMVNNWRSNQLEEAQGEIEDRDTRIVELQAEAEVTALPKPWYLQLINVANPLGADYMPNLSEITPGIQVDTRIAESTRTLLQGALDSGLELNVVAAFRTYEQQRELFLQRMININAAGINMLDAYNEAATTIDVPGASELQAGFALVFGPSGEMSEEEFLTSSEFQWLTANARAHGFILRYPQGQESITGRIYAPGHWRYVGVEAATQIAERGITLEEYIQQEWSD